jgi:hypothetical protein
MPNVNTIKPEETVQNSVSNYFQIFFQTDQEILSWTKSGFHNIEHPSPGSLNIEVFKRYDVVKEYNNASQDATTLPVGNGTLHLVELPF